MTDQTEFLEKEMKQQAARDRVKEMAGVDVKNDWVEVKGFGSSLADFLKMSKGAEKRYGMTEMDISGYDPRYSQALENGEVESMKIFFDENGKPEKNHARLKGSSVDIYLSGKAFGDFSVFDMEKEIRVASEEK
jgi:Zn/Cd-binding protein ZinT